MMDARLPDVQVAVDNLNLHNKTHKIIAVNYDPLNDSAPTSSSVQTTSEDSPSDSSSWVFVDHGAKQREDGKSSKDTIPKEETVSGNKISGLTKGSLLIRDWQSLFDAVRDKDEQKVESLLKKEHAFPSFGQKTLETKSPDGSSVLFQTVLDGQTGIAKMLLRYGADPNVARGRWPRESCLQQATLLGDDEFVRLLLDHGANVILEDGNCQTALHSAASKGNLALASILLHRGANINHKGPKSVTPLAAAVENTQMEMMEYLVSQGSDVTADQKSLEFAMRRDHLEMVEFLLKNGAASKISPKELGMMLVDRAKDGKEPGVVAALLKQGAPVDAENGEPLECAIDHFNQNPIIDLLLDYGADPRFKRSPYNYEKTMEERALHTGNPNVVKVFLEKGLGTRSRNEVLKEYLRYCTALPDGSGHKVVKFLIDQGAEGNLKTSTDYPVSGTMMSPLQWAAYNNDFEMAQTRIAKGDSIGGLSVCHTPLQYAAMNSDEDMVRVLLSHGASSDKIGQNRIGKLVRTSDTPLQLAVDRKNLAIAKYLLENGADANLGTTATSPLATAAKRGDIAFVELLIKHGARLFPPGSSSADPLFTPCYTGNQEVVRKLLDAGCSADEKRTKGIRALHTAGKRGHLEIAKMLLDKGGDVNGWWSQQSLIFAATKEGNEAVVRFLVDSGADPNVKGNSTGMTAMEKAVETCDEALVDALSGSKEGRVVNYDD